MAKTVKIDNNIIKIEETDLRWTFNSKFMKPSWVDKNIETSIITSKAPLTNKVLEEIVIQIIKANPNIKFENIMYDSISKIVLFTIKSDRKTVINKNDCYNYIESVTSELSFKNTEAIVKELKDNSNSKIDDISVISAYDALNYFYNIIYSYELNQKKYITKINNDIKNGYNIPDSLKEMAKKMVVTKICYQGNSVFGNNQIYVSTLIDEVEFDIVIFNVEGETQIKCLQPEWEKEKNIVGIIGNKLNEFIDNIKLYINLQNEEKDMII